MLEVAPDLLGTDRTERCALRFYQGLLAPGPDLAQRPLDLAKSFLDRVVVRGVGRWIQQFAAPLIDELSHPLRLVGAQVVHRHNLTWWQAWREHLLHVG